MKLVYANVIFAVIIITMNVIPLTQSDENLSSGTTNIFKPPEETDVSQIKGTSTPWVKDQFVPIIEEFKKNTTEDLISSPQVQKIYNLTYNTTITRHIFFKLPYKFFTDLGHPVPGAFANAISQSASLSDPLTFPIAFEAAFTNFAEFLLTHNIAIDRGTSTKYVGIISDELDRADVNDAEAVWQAALNAYARFFASYGFNLMDVIDECLQTFASNLIVLHDK